MPLDKPAWSPDESLQTVAPHLTVSWRTEYRRRLLAWFAEHKRDLPWRHTTDAYAIWISESMLQQTQVATVIDYYHRFLARFPNVQALADAEEQDVLAMWAGLGYYRRARQLHAAAKKVLAEHGGLFPTDVDSLQSLPGVGRYTAGAVASIAFDQPAPIVEANTQRVYARLLKQPKPAPELLWQFAQWQLPKQGSRHINQAAMELGSLVCKPVEPLCLVCPIVSLCPTAAAGLQTAIPAPKPKQQFTALHHVAFIIERKGQWLIRQNPAGAWWHGLWDFPRLDITTLKFDIVTNKTRLPTFTAQQLQQIQLAANATLFNNCTKRETSSSTEPVTQLSNPVLSLAHGVTRYRIRLDCLPAKVSLAASSLNSDWRWTDRQTMLSLPLTSTAKKMVNKL